MDCCSLSSTGLQDIDAHVNVSGKTIFNNALKVQGLNILNSIHILNNIIDNDSSTINIS
jgi:hypothetical protein